MRRTVSSFWRSWACSNLVPPASAMAASTRARRATVCRTPRAGCPIPHEGAAPAVGRIAVPLEARGPDVHLLWPLPCPWRNGGLRARRTLWEGRQHHGRLAAVLRGRVAPGRRQQALDSCDAPALLLGASLDRSGLDDLTAHPDPVGDAAPATAQPDPRLPSGLQQDIHPSLFGPPPKHRLAELEALFTRRLAEEALVARAAVMASQVLGGEVAHGLNHPGEDGAVRRDAHPQLALEGQDVHPDEALERKLWVRSLVGHHPSSPGWSRR